MSDTPTPDEAVQADDTTDSPAEGVAPATPQVGVQSLLTRGSDLAARPGFRSPSNNKSKAMKKGKKGKKARKKK